MFTIMGTAKANDSALYLLYENLEAEKQRRSQGNAQEWITSSIWAHRISFSGRQALSQVYPDLTCRKADIDAMILPWDSLVIFTWTDIPFPNKSSSFTIFISTSCGTEFYEIMLICMVHIRAALMQMSFPYWYKWFASTFDNQRYRPPISTLSFPKSPIDRTRIDLISSFMPAMTW